MKTNLLTVVCCMFALGGSLTGCGDEEPQEKKALTGITVDPESLPMVVGTKRVITATPVPADADDVVFQWTSGDETIATVSATGEVEAKKVSATGTDITVRCGKISKTVHVTVSAEVIALESIAVEKGTPGEALTAPYEVEIILGESLKLTPKPVPANSTQTDFAWTKDPATTDILSVNVGGVVSALKKGEAHVVVTESESGETARVRVTVLPKVLTDIALDPDKEETTLKEDQYEDFTAIPVPEGADDTFEWESSDEAVATVNNSGRITGISPGGATVTVSNPGGSVSKKINVTVAAADLIALSKPADGATLAEWPTQFPCQLEWSGVQDYSGGYTIKIADSPENLAATPFTIDAGNNTSFDLTEAACAGLLDGAQIPKDDAPHTLYWTVAPTVATPGIATEPRSINVVRFANIAPKQYWAWIQPDVWSSNSTVFPSAFDDDLSTVWQPGWGGWTSARGAVAFGKEVTVNKVIVISNAMPPYVMNIMRQVGAGTSELWSRSITGVAKSVTINEQNYTETTFTLSDPGQATHLSFEAVSGEHASTANFNEIEVE